MPFTYKPLSYVLCVCSFLVSYSLVELYDFNITELPLHFYIHMCSRGAYCIIENQYLYVYM